MSALSLRRVIVVAMLVMAVCAASTAHAQQYGQNPASRGFVPLANGPVPEGTTGEVGSDTDADGDGFGFGNDFGLSFGAGSLTLTATNVSDSGLLGFLGSFGNLDITFESMSGLLIHLQAVLEGTTLIVNVDFNGGLAGDDFDGDGANDFNDVPDANPADDNTNSDNPDDFDASPGNPFAP